MKFGATIRGWARRAVGTLFIGYVVVLAGTIGPSLAATPDQAPPVAPGQARVWFLRQLSPGTDMTAPMIYANGTPLAISSQGTTFYRDFAPGSYVFSIQDCRPGAQAALTLSLGPGNQFVLQLQQNDFGPMDCGPTFYFSAPAPEMLSSLFTPLRYLGQR